MNRYESSGDEKPALADSSDEEDEEEDEEAEDDDGRFLFFPSVLGFLCAI